MITFFKSLQNTIIAVEHSAEFNSEIISRLSWLFGNAEKLNEKTLTGNFIGPRKEMITPWSTNAAEITQNMGVEGVSRIEEFFEVSEGTKHDPMLQSVYSEIAQDIFTIDKEPEPIIYIEDIPQYNVQEGLALSDDEVKYLEELSERIGRKLSDSEVFGFSQVNSEHCRHKIFNGTFIIDGEEKPSTLFQMIKRTSKENPNTIVSAYKDNVAFVEGPVAEQFAPATQDKPDFFETRDREYVISLKAETHNFPTTVEPFNGAATGTGGEIRDRLAGGKGSLPIAGTAVYITSYPRTEADRNWEQHTPERDWLYQSPEDILIKASNGASDFGNKYGQPLICGSLLTFEHFNDYRKYGYDKVIMLAGGIGYGIKKDAEKDNPGSGDLIVVMGGDNYRIGMGGGAVSSVATGEFDNSIELNAVQRSNPEMQKRVANAIRALVEADVNPIVSIHDHGAGGHLNSLSELVETTGGTIDVRKLPIGDPTLSAKEIIGNESQERMGLIIKAKDLELLKEISKRERAPMYVVGETTGDFELKFVDPKNDNAPIDLKLADMFGNPPKTILTDTTVNEEFEDLLYDKSSLTQYLEDLLQIEAVACKDWLTNKVDRSVTGKIAKQQCTGEIQLPLNDVAVVALDYRGKGGIASSIGHAPVSALVNAAAGSRLSIAESLTNIVWAKLKEGLKSVTLSANWMWPAKNDGENARLYNAVEAVSDFAVDLGINIPTGKDSLSMTQKYPDGEMVYSPGTVIISGAAEVSDVKKVVTPDIKLAKQSYLYYIDMAGSEFELGGSSFAQILNAPGLTTPDVTNSDLLKNGFAAVQSLIDEGIILAGHDISAGGMITTLLEMNFPVRHGGMRLDLTDINEKDVVKLLFSEKPGLIVQVYHEWRAEEIFDQLGVKYCKIGEPSMDNRIVLKHNADTFEFDIESLRDVWYKSSYLLDRKQSGTELALERYKNYKNQPLEFLFNNNFTGKLEQYGLSADRKERTGVKAAIIREKGVNGDREMAYSMHLAGFDVKDVHMTDLINGRETLEDVNFIVYVGGFSNSDVLGSAKGWAGAFLYNPKAKEALDKFYRRNDTMSLGICNGCQLMVELGLTNSDHEDMPKMLHNDSGKFESGFVTVEIAENDSVMLKTLKGTKLGVWIAHGEGKFALPYAENKYKIPAKYAYEQYPANPNGSDYATAAICSDDGRHLAMMPHLERSIFPWQWAHYHSGRHNDEITPWLEAFVNARKWIEEKK